MEFHVNDAIEFERVVWANDANGEPTIFVSWSVVPAVITRVWTNGRYVSLKTFDGKLFVRSVDSPSIKVLL